MTYKKIDLHQQKIVKELREEGFKVLSLATLGKGVPDLLIMSEGILMLVEIKTDKNKLTPQQITFFENWQGIVCIARSTKEIIEAFKAYQNKLKANT